MFFNSLTFLCFLLIFFTIFWSLNKINPKYQNLLILVGSYVFYGWWDWRFLFLLFLTSVSDFLLAQKIQSNQKRKLYFLYISLFINLGSLGFFKYCNFFIDSWINLFDFFGIQQNVSSLNIILPIGISFYTFQTMSYTIDTYYGKIKPTKDFISYMAFVSFFPQLVAGPIERATNFLPQFFKTKKFDFDEASIGFRQIIWGLVKKLVIADNCAIYVNEIFGNSGQQHGLILFSAAVLFAFQVYGDFSGYSDIAIGVARLFGFKLLRNFNYPYFSTNISEFWRNWHISLFKWIHNYIYIPISMKKRYWGHYGISYALIVSFFLSGLWHGANWTFVVFGILNGLGVIFESITRKTRNKIKKKRAYLYNAHISMLITFCFWCFTLVFFRAESFEQAYWIIKESVSFSGLPTNYFLQGINRYIFEIFPIIFGFIVIEWFNKEKEFPLLGGFYRLKTSTALILLLIFGNFVDHLDFIYFQF